MKRIFIRFAVGLTVLLTLTAMYFTAGGVMDYRKNLVSEDCGSSSVISGDQGKKSNSDLETAQKNIEKLIESDKEEDFTPETTNEQENSIIQEESTELSQNNSEKAESPVVSNGKQESSVNTAEKPVQPYKDDRGKSRSDVSKSLQSSTKTSDMRNTADLKDEEDSGFLPDSYDNIDELQPEDSEKLIPAGKKNVINVLFLGIDRTEDRDKTLGVYRTDSIVLASINMDTKKVNVLSIPRDTYAYIPKISKKDKINHAYVWGGMGKKGIQSTIDTVNRFIKYDTIDYYFAIDMEPVPDIIDAIGGVEVDVEIDMKTHGADLSKGKQVLDGKKADTYIRWRYSGLGDIDRIKRQQNFVKALLAKLKNKDQLMNCVKIVLKYNTYVKTDMNVLKLISFANLAKDIDGDGINSYIVPGAGKKINKIWYWIPDEKKMDTLLKKVLWQ